jgi:hypothetical protein
LMKLGLIVKAVAIAQSVTGVTHHDGVWWFTDSAGKPFWSYAVDCVDQGESKKEFTLKNPGFASFRLYESPHQWAEATVKNLSNWGFNSLGGWSDHEELSKLAPDHPLPYFEVLHLGAYAQAPFHDIFAEAAQTAMHNAARDQILKLRSDPMLGGYFTDNELGWWGDTLFISYLAMAPDAPGKKRLMGVIREFYHDDFTRLQSDWITKCTSFDELDTEGKLKLKPGGHGIDLVNAWLAEMATYYYKFVHDAVRAYDTKHLILGDRYCQFYEIPIAGASRPYIDVASTNFGATWNDGTFVHFFLDGLHQLTGKPIVVSEFYMGARQNRSGNKNVPAAFPLVETQKERAAAFLTNVRGLAALPYVIGAHWFQYYDEPPQGRGDGENFNHGFVDTMGRPYEGMVAASQAARPAWVHAASAKSGRGRDGVAAVSRPPVRLPAAVIPMAPSDPLKDLKLWPRERGFVPPKPGIPFADLYVCRDREAIYVGVIAMDYADGHLYEGDQIPVGERMEWTIDVSGSEPIDIRLGGDGQKATCNLPGQQISEVHGLQHIALVRIPLKSFAGKIHLRSSISTHSRGYRMAWEATYPR